MLQPTEQGLPFRFNVPISVFEKSSAAPGRRRRIGGLVSTQSPDRQDEVLLQRGLDFSDFERNGWFNDNHSSKTWDAVGYPTEPVKFVRKGEILPNGKAAPNDGHWAEGYLLEGHAPADRIWDFAQSLEGTGRKLGFSVEGKVLKRMERNSKVVAQAKVRNVAITNCPVNTEATLDVLAKSMRAVEDGTHPLISVFEKAMTMGSADPGIAPTGPITGEGAGQLLTPEALDSDAKEQEERRKRKKKKKLSKAEAFELVRARYPRFSRASAWRITNTVFAANADRETP